MESLVSAPFLNHYADRRVFVTGHTGFKTRLDITKTH